jgi:hypothetical protein
MFQDIGAKALARQYADVRQQCSFDQASELIERYPNLSEVELASLINAYRELSALDVALMISDEKLGRNMEQFYADHRPKLKTPFRQYAILVAIAVVGAAVALWSMSVVS